MPGSMLKSRARRIIIDNFPKILIYSFIYVTLTAIVSWFVFRLPGSISFEEINSRLAAGEMPGFAVIYSNFRPFGVFLALLLYLISPLLDVGFISYCLKINRKQETDYKDLFNGFIFFIKVLAIFIITTFYILLWSILLIIPGIVAFYRYRQAYYILLDDPRKSALQCIEESCLLMKTRKLDLLIIDISFLGWVFLDFIVTILIPLPFVIPIISIWLSPYMGLTRVGFYEDLVTTTAV